MRVKQPCLDASAHATNTPIFGKLNPNPNSNPPVMPKLLECDCWREPEWMWRLSLLKRMPQGGSIKGSGA